VTDAKPRMACPTCGRDVAARQVLAAWPRRGGPKITMPGRHRQELANGKLGGWCRPGYGRPR
jgi:hypothetical protein